MSYRLSVIDPYSWSLIITKSQIDDLVGILRKGIVMATEDIKREGLY